VTYLAYHAVFILPLLLLLAFLTWRRARGASAAGTYQTNARLTWSAYAALPVIALVYTTPWDNYLVFREVWSYPPDRVLARIGYVPVEEYAFFVLQPLLVGLWLFLLLRRDTGSVRRVRPAVRWAGAALLLGIAFAGALMLRGDDTLYLGLILAWAAPVLSAQWAFGGDLILTRARVFWLAVLVPTAYLWLTDLVAIHQGIWSISERYTTGLGVLWLPVEEMVFFLVTNLLVVTGLMLFLHPAAQARVRALTHSVRPWMALVACSALVRIPVPLWTEGFPLLATTSTACLALAALAWAWERVGPRALLLAGLTSGAGLLVEYVGSRTGIPFGAYAYDPPGPTVLGVPLLVPLGWWWMTAAALAASGGRPLLTGALLVALDLGLEPLMTSRGFWTWHAPGSAYYGVPLLNFLGWFVVGSLLAWVLARLAPELRTGGLAWAYRLEAVMLPAGLLLLGLWPAALVTFLTMGVLAWTSSRPAFAR